MKTSTNSAMGPVANPTRFAFLLAILSTFLVAQAQSPSKTPAKPGKPQKSLASKARSPLSKAASEEILATQQDPNAMKGLIDSLRRSATDSARRANARRTIEPSSRPVDSLQALRQADSLRRIDDSIRHVSDSVQRIADSIRRVDSTRFAQRTWSVALDPGRHSTSRFATRVRDRLETELRRTGRVQVRSLIDSISRIDGIWSTARRSGAGKILVVSIGIDSLGRSASMVRLFDLARNEALDSALGDSPDTNSVGANAVAHLMVGKLLPSSRDSACRIDSLRMAKSIWAIAVVPTEMRDTLPARTIADSLLSAVRRSPWASHQSFLLPGGCSTIVCRDSLVKASGATFGLVASLGRQADQAWMLSGHQVRLLDGSLSGSFLVTGNDPVELASRAPSRFLAPPPNCAGACTPPRSQEVWTVQVVEDSAAKLASPSWRSRIATAFRSRTDRQFLSIPADLESFLADSTAVAMGVTRRATVAYSGSDSLWTMIAVVRDPRNGQVDTFAFKRPGPRDRVFPWFARHLASIGARDEICLNPCRSDSARRAMTTWAVVPDPDTTSNLARTALAKSFLALGNGRLDSSLGRTACTDPSCIDSLAWARSIEKTVWPSLVRGSDSAWTFRAKVADMATDVWTDSVSYRDTGSVANFLARCSKAFWKSVNPVRVCDSCLSTDTLEAALAIALPTRGAGTPDSLFPAFRDSLVRIFFREGRYQILDTSIFGRFLGDSASYRRLRCKTGAAFVLRSHLSLEKDGWHVSASLVEIASRRVVASLDYQDKNRRTDRPVALAPWVARRLLGTETRLVAPTPSLDLPWRKIAKIGIPATIGMISVLLHL